MLSLYLLLFTHCSVLAQTVAPGTCKTLPNSKKWPSPASWSKLNNTLGGVLLKPEAPAAACHRDGRDTFNTSSCQFVYNSWNDSSFHARNPTSSLWQQWNDYSCLPDPTSKCSNSGYPLYVVNASTVEHVQAAINFAREGRIRLNIKSTGYDYGGRSSNPRSLSIWTHGLKKQSWYKDGYRLRGCYLDRNGTHVAAGAGTTMRELYREAARHDNLTIIGGSNPAISLGGYLTGQGHSVFSPLYGLGTDQVVEIEVVTANGEVVIANECLNYELFWSLRGGGGGTFGVVTSFVLFVLPKTPVASFVGELIGNQSASANLDAVSMLFKRWATDLTPKSVGGYFSGPITSLTSKSKELLIFLPNVTSTQPLKELLTPIFQEISKKTSDRVKISGTYSWYENTVPKSTYMSQDTDDSPGIGGTNLVTSWLWDKQAVTSPSLRSILERTAYAESTFRADFVGGPGTSKPPFSIQGAGNSVNPAWRTAVMRASTQMHWRGRNEEKLEKRLGVQQYLYAALQELAPEGGAYPGEGNVYDEEFESNFWGANYANLLWMKRSVDPEGVFWCRKCVGSGDWEETDDGGLCKV